MLGRAVKRAIDPGKVGARAVEEVDQVIITTAPCTGTRTYESTVTAVTNAAVRLRAFAAAPSFAAVDTAAAAGAATHLGTSARRPPTR